MRGYNQAVADEELEILDLDADYSFRDRPAVISFLRDNLFLLDLLTEAARKIKNYFGSNAQLALEIFREPEYPESAELFIQIGTSLPPSTARRELDRFDQEWWLEASVRSDCKMNIALEHC